MQGVQNQQFLRAGGTNVLETFGLFDTVLGVYVTDATITVTLYDPDGIAVANAVGIACPWDGGAGEDGVYRGTLLHSIQLRPRTTYKAVFTGTVPGSLVTVWKDSCQCYVVT